MVVRSESERSGSKLISQAAHKRSVQSCRVSLAPMGASRLPDLALFSINTGICFYTQPCSALHMFTSIHGLSRGIGGASSTRGYLTGVPFAFQVVPGD